MLAPLLVHDIQQHAALHAAHLLLAAHLDDGVLQLVVLRVRVRQHGLQQLGGAQLTRLAVLAAGDQGLVAHGRAVQGLQRLPQLIQVPVLHVTLGGRRGDVRGDRVLEHPADLTLHILALEDLAALSVDHLALLVHNLVVLQDILTHLEVRGLHLGLRTLDGVGDHLRVDRLVIRDVQASHHRLHRLAHEAGDQVIAHGEVEAGLARVTLTRGTTTQLVIDTAGLVALRAQHVEATGFADLLSLLLGSLAGLVDLLIPGLLVGLRVLHRVETALAQILVGDDVRVTAQHDVRTTAGHVRRDGHRTRQTSTGDDLRLLLVVLSVQHVVLNATALQQLRQVLGTLHGGGTDQHRLALLHALGDVLGDCL